MRVGLLADTHVDFADWASVRPAVAEAFRGVSLILHCGDTGGLGHLDELGATATVRATRSSGDPPPDPPRLIDGPRVVQAGGVEIGLTFSIDGFPGERPTAKELFSRDVKVVVFGGTHEAHHDTVDGVLWVNPGSPTLSENPTVAVLEIAGGRATARIIPVEGAAAGH